MKMISFGVDLKIDFLDSKPNSDKSKHIIKIIQLLLIFSTNVLEISVNLYYKINHLNQSIMKKIMLVTFLLISTVSVAQKMKVVSGDFINLKGISEFNLVFDYENLKVDKFDTEEDFLKDKMAKRDDEEGKAEDFKKNWFADRENRYEPKFIESFNKRFENSEVKVDKGLSSAKYTIKIKTTWIYPGYNVGVVRQSSKLNTTLFVYENSNPSKMLLTVDYEKALGSGAAGFDYNSGYRISEAYAKLAKTFAADLKKYTK